MARASDVGTLEPIRLDQIDASPDQNRTVFPADHIESLAASIRASGVLVPIKVRRNGARYLLVAGECRTRAARLAGLEAIPAIVEPAGRDDAASLLETLAENVGRRDPDPVDEGRGYSRALETGAASDADTLARLVGVRPCRVRSRLDLLKLSDVALARVRAGDLRLTYAAAIVGLDGNRQLLALHAYAHVPTPPIDAFRDLCERMRNDQAAEGMDLFDTGSFLKVDEWVASVTEPETPEPAAEGPLGLREAAALLEVPSGTVRKWRERGLFPDPAGAVSGTPYWWAGPVMDWAERTGRKVAA